MVFKILDCFLLLYFLLSKVWEGLNAVKGGRTMLGETNPVSLPLFLILVFSLYKLYLF